MARLMSWQAVAGAVLGSTALAGPVSGQWLTETAPSTHAPRPLESPCAGEDQARQSGCLWLAPDGLPRALHGLWPASAAPAWLAVRSGAWYGVAFLPVQPAQASRVSLSLRQPGYRVRMTALQTWPERGTHPPVSLPLFGPARPSPGSWQSAPLALAASSRATGTYLLVEAWSRFEQPPPRLLLAAEPGPVAGAAMGLLDQEHLHMGAWAPPLAPQPPPGPLSVPRVRTPLEPLFSVTSAPRHAPRSQELPW